MFKSISISSMDAVLLSFEMQSQRGPIKLWKFRLFAPFRWYQTGGQLLITQEENKCSSCFINITHDPDYLLA